MALKKIQNQNVHNDNQKYDKKIFYSNDPVQNVTYCWPQDLNNVSNAWFSFINKTNIKFFQDQIICWNCIALYSQQISYLCLL